MCVERLRRVALVLFALLFALRPCSAQLEMTTPDTFDLSECGEAKYGDGCSSGLDCGFTNSICDSKYKVCRCSPEFPVTNHLDKCGKLAGMNETCEFDQQCEEGVKNTQCRNKRCVCSYEMITEMTVDGIFSCNPRPHQAISHTRN